MHHWQDFVLAITALIFSLALVPSIISDNKPALWTSSVTVVMLIAVIVAYASLGLWYATFMAILNALLWFILAAQRVVQMRDKHSADDSRKESD